jgi:SWI/SNF-related matrix-associated actin-dependent regulator of chromatin subfamily A member 5
MSQTLNHLLIFLYAAAANKEHLLEMITHGAEKIVNSLMSKSFILVIEERTMELNSKYEGLNLEDLSNLKSVASVQPWAGEDFRSGVGPF